MEAWKSVAYKFIDTCEFKDSIECAFITGSYASGNADEFSDVDLHLVLRDEVQWRERGNRLVDGFHVEYFANPARQLRRDIINNYNARVLVISNMLENGVVLFDRTGIFEVLTEECRQQNRNGFPPLEQARKHMSFYHVWNDFDELTRAYRNNSLDFKMLYSHFGINIMYTYSQFVQTPLPPRHQLYRWLTDTQFRSNYKLPPFGDDKFTELMVQFFADGDNGALYRHAEAMYGYVQKALGFDIYSFSSRNEC